MACLSERSLNDAAARSARAGASRRALALASGDREAELGTLRKQLMRAKAKVRRATDGGRRRPASASAAGAAHHEAAAGADQAAPRPAHAPARTPSERIASLLSPAAARLRMRGGKAGVSVATAQHSGRPASAGSGLAASAARQPLPRATRAALERAAAAAVAKGAPPLVLETFDPLEGEEPMARCRAAVGRCARYAPTGAALGTDSRALDTALIDCEVASWSDVDRTFLLRFAAATGLEPVEAGRLDVLLPHDDPKAFAARRAEATAAREEAERALRKLRASAAVPDGQVALAPPELFQYILEPQVARAAAAARRRGLWQGPLEALRLELLEDAAQQHALAQKWAFVAYHARDPRGSLAVARLSDEGSAAAGRPLPLEPLALSDDAEAAAASPPERPLRARTARANGTLLAGDQIAYEAIGAVARHWADAVLRLQLDAPLAAVAGGIALPLLRTAAHAGSDRGLPLLVPELVARHRDSVMELVGRLQIDVVNAVEGAVTRAELVAREERAVLKSRPKSARRRDGRSSEDRVAGGTLRRAARAQLASRAQCLAESLAAELARALSAYGAAAQAEASGSALAARSLSMDAPPRVVWPPPLLETSLTTLEAAGPSAGALITFVPPMADVRRALASIVPTAVEGFALGLADALTVVSSGSAADDHVDRTLHAPLLGASLGASSEALRAAVARGECAADLVVPGLTAVASLYARFTPLLLDPDAWAATLDDASLVEVAGALRAVKETAAAAEVVTADVVDLAMCRVRCRVLKDRIARGAAARTAALWRRASDAARSAHCDAIARAQAARARVNQGADCRASFVAVERFLADEAPAELALVEADLAHAAVHWATREAATCSFEEQQEGDIDDALRAEAHGEAHALRAAIAERKEQMLVASAVLDVVDGEPSRGEAWRL